MQMGLSATRLAQSMKHADVVEFLTVWKEHNAKKAPEAIHEIALEAETVAVAGVAAKPAAGSSSTTPSSTGEPKPLLGTLE